jgi:hypothetical protein
MFGRHEYEAVGRYITAKTRRLRLADRHFVPITAYRNADTPTELIWIINPTDLGDIGPCALYKVVYCRHVTRKNRSVY